MLNSGMKEANNHVIKLQVKNFYNFYQQIKFIHFNYLFSFIYVTTIIAVQLQFFGEFQIVRYIEKKTCTR